MYKLLITSIVFTLFSGALLYPQEGYYRNWDGLNPFFQPFNTTDFYGSGDVNGDTKLNQADQDYLNNIITGKYSANIRADVNGDGKIDNSDVSLLQDALNGSILPGWWNRLDNKWARLAWLKKMLALDTTDRHSYVTDKYECYHFALQIYYNFTGYNQFSTYDYSHQTIYNLPVTIAFITLKSGLTHYANAVMLGDNPLLFRNWLFFEPQNDSIIYPGIKTLKAGSELMLFIPKGKQILNFRMDSMGNFILTHQITGLIEERPTRLPHINNLPFCWNPVYIHPGLVLFERSKDNLKRNYSIHIAPLSTFDNPDIHSGIPILDRTLPNRVIAAKQDENEKVHIIWEEGYEEKSYYYGKFNIHDYQLKLTLKLPFLKAGDFSMLRLLVKENSPLVFWVENRESLGSLFVSEIRNNLFQTPEMLLNPKGVTYFDVSLDSSGQAVIYACIRDNNDHNSYLVYNYYNLAHPNRIGGGIFPVKMINIWGDYFVYRNSSIYYYSAKDSNAVYFGFLSTEGEIADINETDEPGVYYVLGLRFVTPQISYPFVYIVHNYWFADKKTFPLTSDNSSTNLTGLYSDNKITLVWQEISNRNSIIKYAEEKLNLTDIRKEMFSEIDFELHQNFPNPFNPLTTINFSIEEPGYVILKVFDILGKEVRTLIDEYKQQGNYSTQFNAENMPSGIYTYQLTANGKTLTRKMLLLK